MPLIRPVATFTDAWNHFHRKMSGYKINRECIEFSYFLDEDGVTHIVILHIEVINTDDFHEMLKKMIDDFPIVWINDLSDKFLGSITIKNTDLTMRCVKLYNFEYKGYRFYESGDDCILQIVKQN